MGLNLGAMGGAAAGGLEDILKQKFLEQIQKGHLRIAQQTADDNTALRKEAQRSAAEDRAARQQAALAQEGTRIGGNLTPGADVSGQPNVIRALSAAGLAPTHKDATLGSTNLSGIVSPAAPSLQGDAVPGIARLARSANPGQAAKDIYGGTDKQREQQQQEDALKALAADPNTPDHIRQFLQVRSAVPGGAVPPELFRDRGAEDAARAANREDMVRLAASLKTPPAGPQPQIMFDKDGKPHAIQFTGGQAHEIDLPDGIIGKTKEKTGKLNPAQQGEVGNYEMVASEAQRILDNLKKTGLDKDNNPITARGRSFIAQKLKVATNDPAVDQLLQNVGYLQTVALRSAAGNQRLTQSLQETFKPHIGDTDSSGARLAAILPELQRQVRERRSQTYRLAGVPDPNETASSSATTAADLIKKYGG